MTVAESLLNAAWSARRHRQLRRLQPIFDGEGQSLVGDSVIFAIGPVRTRVTVSENATCVFGDHVFVGHGCSLSCDQSVMIGDHTRLGPFTLLYDSDFHVPGAHDLRFADGNPARAKSGPVHIGTGVRIGEFVTILRGTTIGDNAVIAAGSVVRGHVPANAHVGGTVTRPSN